MNDGSLQTEDQIELAKRRAQWRQSKRAERARKASKPSPPVDPVTIERIWREKARREQHYPSFLWNNPLWLGGRGTYLFQCDVWAVRTLLEQQHPLRNITAGQIARWMQANQLSHGYKAESLRTMVWRAQKAIAVLETTPSRSGDGSLWPTSDYSLPLNATS